MTSEANWLGPRTALHMVGRALRSRVLWLVLLLAVATTIGVLRVVRPIYRSEVVLFYRPSPGTSFVSQTEGDPSRQLAARLKEMLFTRERLVSLVKEFYLYPAQVKRTGLIDAAEEMRRQYLKFESSGGETFRISFEDESPVRAQAVTARYWTYIAPGAGRMWSRPNSSSTRRSGRRKKCCARAKGNSRNFSAGIPRWHWPWGLDR